MQARTPSLDLDSLYGMGPELQPELYVQGVDPREARFAIGSTSSKASPDADNALLPVSLPFDLPRQPSSAAIIADPRNDENLLVAQTHLAYLKFHNKVLEEVIAGRLKATTPYAKSSKPETPFEKARRMVRWHYQWIIMNELLPALIRPQAIQQVLQHGRKYFKFEDRGPRTFMPLEHSVAAYRLGHSMIRQTYDYNRVFRFGGLAPASLPLLFHFTGNATNQLPGLPTPGAPIPSNWIIDWRRFLKFPNSAVQPNATRKLDTKLANPLRDLPEFRNNPDNQPPALAQRNLLRGSRVGLPTGQAVAEFLKVKPLTADELASGGTSAAVTKHNFHKESPLWFYILKEAEVKENGARLGEVGSTILAETFVGLMEGDELSYLSADRNWKPTLGSQPGQFTLRHIVEWLDIVNPLGEGQSRSALGPTN